MNIFQQIPADWRALIGTEWTQDDALRWSERIEKLLSESDFTPNRNAIFKALELCAVENTKVVVLGQDPYPSPGHANGLAFSTEDFVQPLPKSLTNIFKELKRTVPEYEFPLTGNLTSWSEQGVLLINTCLTTEIGIANAHKNRGWEELTNLILQQLFKHKKGLVGLFWGNQAQATIQRIKTDSHLILCTSHPSPLSVYRGFDGCDHFRKCNHFLLKNDQNAIRWQS